MAKKIILSISGALMLLIVGLLVVALLKPSHYMIERTTEISADSKKISKKIENLHEWKSWSPLEKQDSTVKVVYSGPESGVGATQNWTSEKSGSGELKIIEHKAGEKIRYQMIFKDWNSIAFGEFRFEPHGKSTTVRWVLEGENSFSDKIFWVLFNFEKSISKDFDEGLENLKVQF